MKDRTIQYYEKNFKNYFAETFEIDLSEIYKRFCKYLEKDDHLLDAGCGSGRDSLYFKMNGYKVTSFDASREMCEYVRQKLGLEIINTTFDTFVSSEKFDGIWASASLLHLNNEDLKRIINKLTDSLKIGAIFYMSFKAPLSWMAKNDERSFHLYSFEQISEICKRTEKLDLIESWEMESIKKRSKNRLNKDKTINWINFIFKRSK